MKQDDLDTFITFLKKINKNKFYISHEFINWIVTNESKSELEASDLFDINLKRIHKRIQDHIDYCSENYIVPEVVYDEYDNDVLIKAKFRYKKEDQGLIQHKVEFRDQVFELLKKIDWRELEKLARLILKENHIKDIKITRSTNDQGIDFYGFYRFHLEGFLPRFYKYLNFRIIGQVKHSEKNIGVDYQKVASFGTELNKLRKSRDSQYFENLDDNFLESELPIVGIFITNSYYPKKAVNFAKEYGIIYWNGKQIAEDLCTKEIISSIYDNIAGQLSLDLLKQKISKMAD